MLLRLVVFIIFLNQSISYVRVTSSLSSSLLAATSSSSSSTTTTTTTSSSLINKTYPKHIHSNEYKNDNWDHILGK